MIDHSSDKDSDNKTLCQGVLTWTQLAVGKFCDFMAKTTKMKFVNFTNLIQNVN